VNILPFDREVAAISCLCEGMSIRSTARITGIDKDTIMRLGARVGAGGASGVGIDLHAAPLTLQ
jgi:hypothetical protein